MTEDERRRAERTRVELKETDAAFAGVRAGLVAKLFETAPQELEARERIYLAVHVLDQVLARMSEVVRSASDTQTIDAFVEALRGQN